MLAALTGPVASAGQAEEQAMKAAITVLNAKGGILSHKIELTVKDDQASPTTAISELQQALKSSTPPDYCFCGTTSTETLAMAPIQETGAAAAYDASKYPYNFSLSPTDQQADTELGTLAASTGAKKVGILTSNDVTGSAELPYLEQGLKAKGVSYVRVTYSDTALDMTSQLQKLQSAGVDLLFFEALGAPAGYILQGRTQLGWRVPVLGDFVTGSNDLATLVPAKDLSGVSLCVFKIGRYVAPADRSPAYTTYLNALKAQGKVVDAMDIYSLAYDPLQIIAVAAKQAGSVSGTAITQALNTLKQLTAPPWVTWDTLGYTLSSHLVSPPSSDFGIVPAGPLVDGTLGAPAGTSS
jgi:branched-chain amino acid transport system substrate-binding protein